MHARRALTWIVLLCAALGLLGCSAERTLELRDWRLNTASRADEALLTLPVHLDP